MQRKASGQAAPAASGHTECLCSTVPHSMLIDVGLYAKHLYNYRTALAAAELGPGNNLRCIAFVRSEGGETVRVSETSAVQPICNSGTEGL
jgi:hypothetical protein